MSHLVLVIAALLPHGGPTDPVLGPALVREVRLAKRITCDSRSGNGRLDDVEVRVAVPRSNERQDILSLRYSRKPDRFLEDGHGNSFAVFDIPRIAAGESVEIGWTARVRTRLIEHKVEAATLSDLSRVPEPVRNAYLGSHPRYGMEDSEVRTAAARIGKRARNPLDLAFRINEYLRERLTYRNDGRWENADDVLRNRHGSCSEYNFAFIALARLNGLPARYVGATALRNDGPSYEDTVHHRWTEVYLPGYGWFPVDASRNDGEEGDPPNRWFGKTSSRLLVLMKGDGGAKHPLGWAYVARVFAKRHGDAIARSDKRFHWRRLPRDDREAARRR